MRYNDICMVMATSSLRGESYMSERSDDNYISLEDAAEYLNIKPVTLRKWIKQKESSGTPNRTALEVQALRIG